MQTETWLQQEGATWTTLWDHYQLRLLHACRAPKWLLIWVLPE
ncbi:hypothetical protein HU200_040567 [Digitaria exilis]|uniref:Uncharacterized protein n=1 Tax=Digitaria exilis TaxID=1010633 RepID=A0A835B918_9POAL|nr:hypothetical protein HU200_040567 [Digitaria exilis]